MLARRVRAADEAACMLRLRTRTRRLLVATLVLTTPVGGAAVAALPGPVRDVVDAATAHAATKQPTKLGGRGLRKGMRGRDVKDLQRLLNRAGFRTPITGTFASHTVRSVVAFQRAAGLEASGAVGRTTVRLLRGAAASGGAAPMAPPAEVTSSSTPEPDATAPAPGQVATITAEGLAVAPKGAPKAVVDLIAAGNEIARTPYRYGGGHRSFKDDAYDCSGSVGYALHGAGLLDRTVTSGELETWGESGPGSWITVYANADHTFLVVAGIRFDTSGQKQAGTRWQPAERSLTGFVVRHPARL